MIIRNEDVVEVIAEIPEGHKHLRTTLRLQDGTELVMQEATVANMVRAYVSVKTHPRKVRVTMKGVNLEKRKEGYAEWQLLEEEDNE